MQLLSAYSRPVTTQTAHLLLSVTRSLFPLPFKRVLSFSLLLSSSLSLHPLIALSLISFDEREVRKKKKRVVYTRAGDRRDRGRRSIRESILEGGVGGAICRTN